MIKRQIATIKKLGASEIFLDLLPAVIGLFVIIKTVFDVQTYGETILLSQAIAATYSMHFGTWCRYLFNQFGYAQTYFVLGTFFVGLSIGCFVSSLSMLKKKDDKKE